MLRATIQRQFNAMIISVIAVCLGVYDWINTKVFVFDGGVHQFNNVFLFFVSILWGLYISSNKKELNELWRINSFSVGGSLLLSRIVWSIFILFIFSIFVLIGQGDAIFMFGIYVLFGVNFVSVWVFGIRV